MRSFCSSRWLVGFSAMLALPAAIAAERVQVTTSFSILADMVENVGGEHVEVTSLVGPDSDTHAYSPSPGDARALSEADLVVFNGLQFEGWMERLIEASDYSGPVVTATAGIDTADADAHDDHAHGDDDPHAWQDLTLGKVYVTNIRDGLIEANPENAATYRENAERYINELEATDEEIHQLIGEIPASTSVITGHDSFSYFSSAYGVRFLSPAGLSSASEASATNMAQLIDVIREQNVQALFHENMTNPAVLNQLAEETGLPVAGTLYTDALASEGEASTYLGMMRHNAQTLNTALADPDHDDQHGHSH
ncbi:zinc ABC transporter substrate-binding protein [Halomonas sediminis]